MVLKTPVTPPERPASMSRRFAQTMPDKTDRPIRDNASVREEAARRILPEVCAQLPGHETTAVEAYLYQAVRWENQTAGIIKKLMHKLGGGEASDGLPKIIDELAYHIDVVHEMMVKTWVRMNRIEPQVVLGESVVATIQKDLFETRTYIGVVTEIIHDTAKYKVKTKVGEKYETLEVAYEHVASRKQDAPRERTVKADAVDQLARIFAAD